MRGLRTLLLILVAAVFAVGGPLRALPCHAEPTAPPPCHEVAGQTHGQADHKAPVHKPKPDALAMSCCVGCLPAAVRDVAPVAAPAVLARIAFATVSPSLDGLSPAPDHDPPRPLV